jgi:arabinan endo-1,5-alpha-L-arabinosidase
MTKDLENIQHPTSNTEHPMRMRSRFIGCWLLDVGRWIFSRFAVHGLVAGSLLLASSGWAQTSPGTSTPIGSAQVTADSSTTNNSTAPRRGGARFGRANRPMFDSQETNRLHELGNRDIRVHDPSTIVKSGGEYWIFYTGMRVPSYHSKDLITWERGPSALTNVPAWTTNVPGFDGRSFWAPDVIHLAQRYLLYYSASVFGKNTSGIGLTTSPTLDPADPDFHWTDRGMIVQSNVSDDFNTIDPAVTLDADGRLWLAFGSFWSGIRLIELDPKTGLRIAPDSRMYYLAHHDSIEASFIYRHGRHYYLFVNWGYCCRGADSTYEIRVGRSETITGPYLDREGKDLLLGGGSKVLSSEGAFIGPGHAGILAEGDHYWFACHFYDGTTPWAESKFAIRQMHWDAEGWPVVDSETQK